MAKLASIDERNGRLFAVPHFRTIMGVYVEKGPVVEIASRDPAIVGRSILEALEACEDGLPTPDWKNYESPVYTTAGVRGWSEYVRGLRSCSVTQTSSGITIIPKENRGPRDGLVELTDEEIVIAGDVDASALGNAALRGLSMSRINRS